MTPLYRNRRPRLALRFWAVFIWETLTQRRVARLIRARLHGETKIITGLAHLPPEGAFVLAVNHYNGRGALDVMAAVMQAVATTRPDAVDAMLFIAGGRATPPTGIIPRLIWRMIVRIQQRWSRHLIRVPIKNDAPLVAGLRAWRTRQQPTFVFPEGRGSLTLRRMRGGVGRWLHLLGLPVVPVAVWWERDEQGARWHVHIGKPLVWTHRPELRDLQLGLALASLLPPALAPVWQEDLKRWREAHAPKNTAEIPTSKATPDSE
jgi:hypothetical protein